LVYNLSVEDRVSVGASVPRVDGVDKVRGAAVYVDDISLPEMMHGATVRSPVARGIFRGIERDPDFDWTGITIATAEDIPGENHVYLIETDQPCLVPIGGEIRHPTEPLAVVVAETRARAFEAVDHLLLDIEELPAVFTLDDSIAAEVKLHGDDNVFKRFAINKGDVDAGFAEADVIIEGTYETGAQEQMYIEPQGMIARWHKDTCEITGSLQCPYYVHKAMVPLLGNCEVIIAQAVTGGGFGGKEEYPSMIAGHAAIAARKAGKPVKMIYDRDEDIAATTKRHPSRTHHKIGLKKDGSITAIEVDVLLDGGAYVTLSPVVLSRAVLHAAGPYRCDNVKITGRAMATNYPPHGAFRGFGAPQTTFAYERQMDKAARALGMSPIALRRYNMLRSGDTTATGQLLEASVGSEAVMKEIIAANGASEVGADSGGGGDPPVKRGRGVAFYFHGAGFTGSGEQRLAGKATLAALQGGGFEVRSSSTDIGQGALTMFTQIAATGLGVDIDQVRVAPASTAVVPDSGPTVASRTCMVVGGVVDRAAKGLRLRLETWAADNGMSGEPIEAIAAAMTEASGEVAETVQYKPPPGIVWDDETYTGSAYPVFGWAACLVDVAVDLDTGEVAVERCVHAIDVGKAIHPIIVKGQIEGGTLQALGWALLESVVYKDGAVVNDRMQNSIVPTFADAPEMETILVEEPYPFGPHGAKGVGEIPMDGPAAAVASAVSRAIGVDIDRLPLLPETILEAIS
jgi:CO/xanthine dehydrogenase Mo-binding subunit